MTAPRTNAAYDQNRITTLMGVSTADGVTATPVEVDPTTGALVTSATLIVGDIEIGAVELKNGTDDTRATITASNALKVDGSAAPQPITDNSSSITVDAPVSTPVFVRLSDGSAAIATMPTKETRSTIPTQTSPSVTNVNTSILVSNANRLGATIYNEGTAICYLKLGTTATISSYSCQIASGGYYEVPFAYTGAIDGITSASTAQLRVAELT